MKRSPQQAMALVITLIMLSLITVVAVAFLALARRDRASVTQAANITDSQLMADAAVQRAIAELGPKVHRFFDPTNGWVRGNFCSLLVSTNQDLNLNGKIDARAPVWITSARTGKTNRWNLDLNRDWHPNETGLFDLNGQLTTDTNQPVTFLPGDPQWIAVLERPWDPHGPNNRFIGRYVVIALPVGKALDANYIFNESSGTYLRGKGFGSWEINLPAFLADLNTNIFKYNYSVDPSIQSGSAFLYSRELLNYRYNGNPNSLATPAEIFANAPWPLKLSALDFYYTNNLRWPGSDNPNRYYTLHDYFHSRGTYFGAFGNLLIRLPDYNLTTPYDLSTYYRLIEQLGTDSLPEPPGKININFVNTGTNSPLNLAAWSESMVDGRPGSEVFFLETADRLLRTEYPDMAAGAGIWRHGVWTNNGNPIQTNLVDYNLPGIPILIANSMYTTNYWGTNWEVKPLYSSRVHQLLQITANIYDATHGKGEQEPYFPTVFRPQYASEGGNVSIKGYVEETGTNFIHNPWVSLTSPDAPSIIQSNPNVNVYGIPFIVGARKGHPNFNELLIQNVVQVERKMELVKNDPASTNISEYRQMFIIGISNIVGVEAWNSYKTTYKRNVTIAWKNENINSVALEYSDRRYTVSSTNRTPQWFLGQTNSAGTYKVPSGAWLGYNARQAFMPPQPYAAISTPILPNSAVTRDGGLSFIADTNIFVAGASPSNIGLAVTNLFAFFIIDTDANRVIDAVSLSATNYFDITRELNSILPTTNSTAMARLWDPTEIKPGFTVGMSNQIYVCLNANASSDDQWGSYPGTQSKDFAISDFITFVSGTSTGRRQTPFNPIRKMYQTVSLQANDPLVHYRLEDLQDNAYFTNFDKSFASNNNVVTLPYKQAYNLSKNSNLGDINSRYKPWNYETLTYGSADINDTNILVKDPQVASSDNWDFPAEKFPNIGWLGRVHRGTPWQTINLKAGFAAYADWARHTGRAFAVETHPAGDRNLVGLFTVAVNSNATRGTLSINQTNVAAWSAVLSGITVNTLNPAGDGKTNLLVQPAAIEPAVAQIVAGINRQREARVHGMKNIQFDKLGDILATPELTLESPFFKPPYVPEESLPDAASLLTDRDYEAIPEQILSLLKQGDDRFVIYAWGQSLKPAPNSIITSGNNFGVCTNYQITGEMATRTVVHFTTNNHAVVERYNLLPPE